MSYHAFIGIVIETVKAYFLDDIASISFMQASDATGAHRGLLVAVHPAVIDVQQKTESESTNPHSPALSKFYPIQSHIQLATNNMKVKITQINELQSIKVQKPNINKYSFIYIFLSAIGCIVHKHYYTF